MTSHPFELRAIHGRSCLRIAFDIEVAGDGAGVSSLRRPRRASSRVPCVCYNWVRCASLRLAARELTPVLPELCQPVRSRVECLRVEASHFEATDRVQTVARLVCAMRQSPSRGYIETRMIHGVRVLSSAVRVFRRRIDVGGPVVRRG